jgi:nucleoid DNA-binding protein
MRLRELIKVCGSQRQDRTIKNPHTLNTIKIKETRIKAFGAQSEL